MSNAFSKGVARAAAAALPLVSMLPAQGRGQGPMLGKRMPELATPASDWVNTEAEISVASLRGRPALFLFTTVP